MKNLHNMTVAPRGVKKVLISEQGSNGFRSLGNTKGAVKKVIEVEPAVETVTVPVEEVSDIVIEVPLPIDYSGMTVASLKGILDEAEVEYTATKKADLIELVEGL